MWNENSKISGQRCGPNETGEICVHTPFAMICYLNRPKETGEYFDSEGFSHTGDLGFYDNKGRIVYVDRMKEVIKYKNNHVSPTEIEDILQKHEAVQDCLVFGKKEPSVQELISAVVAVKPDAKVSYLSTISSFLEELSKELSRSVFHLKALTFYQF